MEVTALAALATLGVSIVSIIAILVAMGRWQGVTNQKIDVLFQEKDAQQKEITTLLGKYEAVLSMLYTIQVAIAKNTATLETTLKGLESIVTTNSRHIDELRTKK